MHKFGVAVTGLALATVVGCAPRVPLQYDHPAARLYVISGRGIAEIGDEQHEVGPGDVMLFTAPSEIGEYPRLRKRAIFEKRKDAYIVDLNATRPFRT